MFGNAYASDFVMFDYHTESADTAITEEVQGNNGKRLYLVGYEIVSGDTTTQSTLSIMYAGGTRSTVSSHTAGDSVMVFGDSMFDPGAAICAAGDEIAYQLDNGVWEFNTVSTCDGGDSVTFDTAVVGTITSGSRAVVFGVVGDGACFNIAATVSAATTRGYDGIYARAPHKGDPMMTSYSNVEEAGKVNNLVFGYYNK